MSMHKGAPSQLNATCQHVNPINMQGSIPGRGQVRGSGHLRPGSGLVRAGQMRVKPGQDRSGQVRLGSRQQTSRTHVKSGVPSTRAAIPPVAFLSLW